MGVTRLLNYSKLWLRAWKYKTKYDKGGIAYIRRQLRRGQTALDIGAHKGGYLFWMQRQVGDEGRIAAFEPQAHLYRYLVGLKSVLGWRQTTIARLALSDAEGQTTLYIPMHRQGGGASSPGATIVSQKAQGEGDCRVETVHTQTLDAYCAEHALAPDFLKIDVEGNELRVFRGGEQTLRKYKPRILVEIEARHVGAAQVRETLAYMAQLGYSGFFIHGSKLRPIAEFSLDRYQNPQNMRDYCNNFVFE
ncbi:MAG: FkbM family methyltransferase [Saprospiraceae bacterium]